MTTGNARRWPIDALRGVAVLAMISFHGAWDLATFGIAQIAIYSTGWQAYARSIGLVFTFLLGVAAVLTDVRQNGEQRRLFFRRGLIVLACGMLVTLATYAVVGESFVRFGILHLQGTMLLLIPLLLRLRPVTVAAVGIAMLSIGAFLAFQTVETTALLWLGLAPRTITMVDYYPLLPWGGAAPLGVAVGWWLVRRPTPSNPPGPFVRPLCWLGRHSLLIYLLHQPILIGLLLGAGYRVTAT